MAFRQQSSEVNRGCSRGLTQAFCRSVYKAYIALYAVVNNHEEIQPISKTFLTLWYIPFHYLWGKPKWIRSSTVKDIIRPVVSVALMCYHSIVSVVWRRIHSSPCLLAWGLRESDCPVLEAECQQPLSLLLWLLRRPWDSRSGGVVARVSMQGKVDWKVV